MTIPGPIVKSGANPSASSPPIDIGQWFIAGVTEKGASDKALGPFRNLDQLIAVTGSRVAYSQVYDAAQTFFGEGGSVLYVARVVGPESATSTVSLSNGSSNTLKVTASSPGEWGNGLEVITTIPVTGSFKFQIKLGGVLVEESPAFETNTEAVAWAATISQYIRLEDLGQGDPVAATKSLASGKDDHAAITEANWTAALKLFTRDLGAGQVSMPGRTTAEAQGNLLTHAKEYGRLAILDGTDTATIATLVSQAATLRAQSTARYGGLFAPWAVIPGISPGTTRTVPYSAVQAGIMARNDGDGLNPNVPAAGPNGVARYAVGLSQAPWTDAQRGELNDAGVDVARVMNGAVRTYGYRTLVNGVVDSTWVELSNARLDAYIKAQCQALGERFEFRQIGKKVPAEFGSAIEGEVLLPLFNAEALYGDIPGEAYAVDTGEAVNTEQTLAEGKLKAVASVRMSPFAEVVEITIVKEAI